MYLRCTITNAPTYMPGASWPPVMKQVRCLRATHFIGLARTLKGLECDFSQLPRLNLVDETSNPVFVRNKRASFDPRD